MIILIFDNMRYLPSNYFKRNLNITLIGIERQVISRGVF
jgi:hypothetical protein